MMTQYVITELEQLKELAPGSKLRIHNLNLDGQDIEGENVILYDCTGAHVSINARWLSIQAGNLTSVSAHVAEAIEVSEASMHRLLVLNNLQSVVVDRANVRHLELQDAEYVHITKSWLDTLAARSIEFARLVNAYIGTASTSNGNPVIFARDAAINYTTWPFVDGGPDNRGFRVNVFRGARTTDSRVVVTSHAQLERAERALVITAGCRAFTSFEDAVAHWQARRNGMLPLVRKAVDLLTQKEEKNLEPYS
jgi:hypothetical protein